LNVARKEGRISSVPYLPMFRGDNVRQRFFETDDFNTFVALLPEPVAEATRFGT
jgi:hypothetical protein